MLIAQISDSHIAVPATSSHCRTGNLEACVDHIAALDPLPDLVVHTGDVAHNGKAEEYAQAADLLGTLPTRLHVIPGNRDDRQALRAAFASLLPADCHAEFVQYAYMQQDLCLIMLDTVSEGSNKGQLCELRLAHLNQMLDNAGDRQLMIFMHHPPFDVTAAADPFQFESRGNAAAFAGILSQHPKVRHVYCGHSHRAASGMVGGVPASTIPSMAEDLRQGPVVSMEKITPLYHIT